MLAVNRLAGESLSAQLRNIRSFAGKSVQKCAEFLLAGAGTSLHPGGNCLLKKPLRVLLQRHPAHLSLRGKLGFHLRVEFHMNRHCLPHE